MLIYAAVVALLLTFRVWKRAHAVPAGVRRESLVQSAAGARRAS